MNFRESGLMPIAVTSKLQMLTENFARQIIRPQGSMLMLC